MWQEALRLAEHYLPQRVQEIHAELAASMRAGGGGTALQAAAGVRRGWLPQGAAAAE
jgi:hypothetical protein